MANRREFLGTGLAVTALPIAGVLASQAHAAAAAAPVQLHKVVHDERFADSRAFADRARRLGGKTHGIEGDVTALWFNDLDQQWRTAPSVIGGLTSAAALFCLERLAWDQGHRTVFRAEHTPLAGGGFRHTVIGGQDPKALAKDLKTAGAAWPVLIAQTLLGMPAGALAAAPLPGPVNTLKGQSQGPLLVSWLIAPKA